MKIECITFFFFLTNNLMYFFKKVWFLQPIHSLLPKLKKYIKKIKIVNSGNILSHRDFFIKQIDLYLSCFFASQIPQLGCRCIWVKPLGWTNILWALFQGYQWKWGFTAQPKCLRKTITLSIKFCLCVNLGIYCMAHRACAAASNLKSITLEYFPLF